jgi:spore germination protein YaaH
VRAAVYLPFWYSGAGSALVLAQRRLVGEVSPWIYGLSPAGVIEPQYSSGDAGAVDADIARLRAAGLRIVPSVANATGDEFSYEPIAGILADSARRRAHVAALAALVRSAGYAGIDVDYEELHSGDRQSFTDLLTELAEALHADGKTLSVALFAKDSDRGYDERNLAQDYAAAGAVADEVRLMGYDYHWSTSPAGPLAPMGWLHAVLDYASTQIDPAKILLGVGLYGYDWTGGHGTPVSWRHATNLAASHGADVRFDGESQSPSFTYTDRSGARHEVWFENAAGSRAKFRAAATAGIGGLFFWMFGEPDPGTWPALAESATADPW